MEYNHPVLSVSAAFPADDGAIATAIAKAQEFASRAACGADAEARLCIIIEELVANIVEHGAAPAGSLIALTIDAIGQDIGLTLDDGGTPFDPRLAEAPGDIPPERGGGAGIALVMAWSRAVEYRHDNGRNRLTLVIPAHG